MTEEALPTWDETQKVLIEQHLAHHKGNKVRTAKSLGISVRSLRYKIHRFNMNEWKGILSGSKVPRGCARCVDKTKGQWK